MERERGRERERERETDRQRSICGAGINALDCNIVIREFELLSHYFVYFRTNALGKGMKL